MKFLFPGGICTSVGFRHGNSERSSGLPAFVGHVTPVSWFLCVCLGCGLGARAGDGGGRRERLRRWEGGVPCGRRARGRIMPPGSPSESPRLPAERDTHAAPSRLRGLGRESPACFRDLRLRDVRGAGPRAQSREVCEGAADPGLLVLKPVVQGAAGPRSSLGPGHRRRHVRGGVRRVSSSQSPLRGGMSKGWAAQHGPAGMTGRPRMYRGRTGKQAQPSGGDPHAKHRCAPAEGGGGDAGGSSTPTAAGELHQAAPVLS